jgi:hypothetical protein
MAGDDARGQIDPPSRCPLAELPSQWASWRCQAPGYEGVAFSSAYVDQYCMTAHHAECRIFKRFGNRSELLAQKRRALKPSETRAEPAAREKADGTALQETARQEPAVVFTIDSSSDTGTPNHRRKETIEPHWRMSSHPLKTRASEKQMAPQQGTTEMGSSPSRIAVMSPQAAGTQAVSLHQVAPASGHRPSVISPAVRNLAARQSNLQTIQSRRAAKRRRACSWSGLLIAPGQRARSLATASSGLIPFRIR